MSQRIYLDLIIRERENPITHEMCFYFSFSLLQVDMAASYLYVCKSTKNDSKAKAQIDSNINK